MIRLAGHDRFERRRCLGFRERFTCKQMNQVGSQISRVVLAGEFGWLLIKLDIAALISFSGITIGFQYIGDSCSSI
jgi:hypothetical protein